MVIPDKMLEEIERKKEMKEKLQNIREEALKAIQSADVPEKLNDVRVKFLGKKGELTAVLKSMKDVAAEDRPKIGQMVNDARAEIEAALEESKKKMDRAIREEKMKREVIYRIVQESITNSIRHGEASRILVDIERKYGTLIVKIKDNGKGCKNIQKGFGLHHMEERLQLLQGQLTYNGDDGFTVEAQIPIRWGETEEK